MRRKYIAQMEEELEIESSRIKAECDGKRAQALAVLQQHLALEFETQNQVLKEKRKELSTSMQQLEQESKDLVLRQNKLKADAAALEQQLKECQEQRVRVEEEGKAEVERRRQAFEDALQDLEREWSDKLQDTTAACDKQLQALQAMCMEERQRCEEERKRCNADLLALRERYQEERQTAEQEGLRQTEEDREVHARLKVEMERRLEELEQHEKVLAEEMVAQVREQAQVLLEELEQEHDDKIRQACEQSAEKVAAMQHECEQRLDDFVRKVEEDETMVQGRHDEMVQAAEKEVAARLMQAADECNAKVHSMEQECEEQIKVLVKNVEEEEAKLQACQHRLKLARQEAEQQREAVLASAADELSGDLSKELEAELAHVRNHHQRLLVQRRQHEEHEFKRAFDELQTHFEQQLAKERAHALEQFEKTRALTVEEFEKESAAIREEVTVKDALALDDLRKHLANDRRRASALAIDEAIRAAKAVRKQTSAILREELDKEIESVVTQHTQQRDEKMATLNATHAAKVLKMERQLHQQQRVELDSMQAAYRKAAEAQRLEAERDAKRELTGMLQQVREVASKELDQERVKLQEQDKQARQALAALHEEAQKRSHAALVECEQEWALELEKSLAELRQKLAEKAKTKTAAIAQSLRDLAHVNTESLKQDFMACLAAETQRLAATAAYERLAELAIGDEARACEQAFALEVLEKEIDAENQAKLRRLVDECVEKRREAVERIEYEASTQLQQERAQLDEQHALRLSDALDQLRANLAQQAREQHASVLAEEEHSTSLELTAARHKGEELTQEALRLVSRDFEQQLQVELQRLTTEQAEAHEATLQALREELERTRDKQLLSARSEVEAKTSKEVEKLEAQLELERQRRMQAMQRSCLAETRRRTLEIDMEAQAQVEQALLTCRADAQEEHDNKLAALQHQHKADTDKMVSDTREKARQNLQIHLQTLAHKYAEERGAAGEQLRVQLAQQLADTLQQKTTLLQQEAHDQVEVAQRDADAALAAALGVLQKEHTTQTEAALAGVREECERERERQLAALDRNMAVKRHDMLKQVEKECEHEIKTQSDEMQALFSVSRDQRVRNLKTQLEKDTQEQIEQKDLRAQLELARQVNSLRAECLADMERCRRLVEGRNREAAQKLMSLMRLKCQKESDARMTAVERGARKQQQALVQELRDEWREIRCLIDAAPRSASTGTPAPRTAATFTHHQDQARQCTEGYDVMCVQVDKLAQQVEELQMLLEVVAEEATILSNEAKTAHLASCFAFHRQRAHSPAAAKHSMRAWHAPDGSDAYKAMSRGARRALSYPASDSVVEGHVLACADMEVDSGCEMRVGSCDLSTRSTLPSDTPAKSLIKSIHTSLDSLHSYTPHLRTSPAHKPASQDTNMRWSSTLSEPMRMHTSLHSPNFKRDSGRECGGSALVVRNAMGIEVSPIKHAIRLDPHGSPILNSKDRHTTLILTPATMSSDCAEGADARMSADSLQTISPTPPRAPQKQRAQRQMDSGDSLDDDDEQPMVLQAGAADGYKQKVCPSKVLRQQHKQPQKEQHSVGQERDRLLFSLLRRSSTRRSLTKIFSASAPLPSSSSSASSS